VATNQEDEPQEGRSYDGVVEWSCESGNALARSLRALVLRSFRPKGVIFSIAW
jgi:hypothetical protein